METRKRFFFRHFKDILRIYNINEQKKTNSFQCLVS